MLANLDSIRRLALHNNQFHDIPSAMAHLVDTLEQCTLVNNPVMEALQAHAPDGVDQPDDNQVELIRAFVHAGAEAVTEDSTSDASSSSSSSSSSAGPKPGSDNDDDDDDPIDAAVATAAKTKELDLRGVPLKVCSVFGRV